MLSLCVGRKKVKNYNTFLTFWTFQGTIQLEKELAYLGSVCAAALMKKDLALPIGRTYFCINPCYKLCVTAGRKFILCNILSKSFICYFNLFLLWGNELEEDLEILEEASLQVCYLLNSEIFFPTHCGLVKSFQPSSFLDSYFLWHHPGM